MRGNMRHGRNIAYSEKPLLVTYVESNNKKREKIVEFKKARMKYNFTENQNSYFSTFYASIRDSKFWSQAFATTPFATGKIATRYLHQGSIWYVLLLLQLISYYALQNFWTSLTITIN